jgi:ankyrin repeat protein
MLLERGADVSAYKYRNVLESAVYWGNTEVAVMLLKKGADYKSEDLWHNALEGAAQMGTTEIVKMLLEEGADVNAQGGKYGNALQAAATTFHYWLVNTLLEKGADINAQGGKYGTAFQAAKAYGDGTIQWILLEKGAKTNRKNRYSIAKAIQKGNIKAVLEQGEDVSYEEFIVSSFTISRDQRNRLN